MRENALSPPHCALSMRTFFHSRASACVLLLSRVLDPQQSKSSWSTLPGLFRA